LEPIPVEEIEEVEEENHEELSPSRSPIQEAEDESQTTLEI